MACLQVYVVIVDDENMDVLLVQSLGSGKRRKGRDSDPFAAANAADKERPRPGNPENGPAIGLSDKGLASRWASMNRCNALVSLRGPSLPIISEIVNKMWQ